MIEKIILNITTVPIIRTQTRINIIESFVELFHCATAVTNYTYERAERFLNGELNVQLCSYAQQNIEITPVIGHGDIDTRERALFDV